MEGATITVATLMTAASDVFTTAIGTVATVASTIASNQFLLLACVGVPLCGIGIGMIKRLLSASV